MGPGRFVVGGAAHSVTNPPTRDTEITSGIHVQQYVYSLKTSYICLQE